MAKAPMLKAHVRVELPAEIKTDEFEAFFDKESEAIADFVVERAKASAAFVDQTGKLRKSIKKKKIRNPGEEYWIVKAEDPKAHLVEHGHVLTTKDGRPIGHVSAKPFLGPAAEEGIDEASRRFREK